MQHPRVAGFVLLGTLALLTCALRYGGSLRAGQQPEPSCVATDIVATPQEAIVCPLPPGCCVPPSLASTEDLPVPIVALHVRVPATAPVGQELEYHLSIENRSSAAAHHVVLRNPLPPNSRFVRAQPPPVASDPELLWTFGTLEGGGHREVVLVLAPTGTEDLLDCAARFSSNTDSALLRDLPKHSCN